MVPILCKITQTGHVCKADSLQLVPPSPFFHETCLMRDVDTSELSIVV